MDDAAFLAGILAEAESDVPRLVYADYLEEHGDADRAEFIRLQCELARLDETDPRRPALEDREHDLLDQHEAAWFPGGEGITEWEFRRGFVESVTADPRSISDELLARHTLTTATIFREVRNWEPVAPERNPAWESRITDLDLSALQMPLPDLPGFAYPIPNLRKLKVLGDPDLTDLGYHLYVDSLYKRLQSLVFGDTDDAGRGAVSTDLSPLCEVLSDGPLETLSAANCRLSSADLQSLLRSLPRLKNLDISQNELAPHTTEGFRQSHAQLERLDVSHTALGRASLGEVLLSPACASLRALHARGCWPVGPAGEAFLHAIGDSPFWNQCQELDLRDSPRVDFRHLRGLFEGSGSPPGLRRLFLNARADVATTPDNTIRELLKVAGFDGLTWLTLTICHAVELEAISRHSGFSQLRTLQLTNLIGSAAEVQYGVSQLTARSKNLSRLRLLTLWGFNPLFPGTVEAVLNADGWKLSGLGLPNCGLTPDVVPVLANSPRLHRLTWLDLSRNPALAGDLLLPLAESPYLSRLCEVDVRQSRPSERVRSAFDARLGPRFSS